MLAKGMNPGGFSQKVLWANPEEPSGHWRELYVWSSDNQTVVRRSDLSPEHYERIQEHSLIELIDIVFASGRRSLEGLCLALPTTDRLAACTPLVQQAADGVIQLLGAHRSRLSTHGAIPLQSGLIPAYVRDYLHAVARQNDENPDNFQREVIALL